MVKIMKINLNNRSTKYDGDNIDGNIPYNNYDVPNKNYLINSSCTIENFYNYIVIMYFLIFA